MGALRLYLPAALAGAHGYYSAEGAFEANGLTHTDLARTLRAEMTVRLEGISLGEFNPVRTLARRFGMDLFEARIPAAVYTWGNSASSDSRPQGGA